MQIKKSPLELQEFLLLKQNINFIQSERNINSTEINGITSGYSVDIDFALNKVEEDLFQMFVKIEINLTEDKLPGYSIFSEGVGIFKFDYRSVKNKNDKISLLHFSGLSICINSLRSIIAGVTAHGPFGKYTLPSIDVNQLLKDKKNTEA